MQKFRSAVAAALVMSMAAGVAFVAWDGPASAAETVYSCSGATGDQASYDLFPGNNVQSSAQVLNTLAATIPNFPAKPSVAVGITPSVPATGTTGSGLATRFDITLTLPATLVNGAKTVGLSSVTVRNATFAIGVVGGTPTRLSSVVASRVVPLVANTTLSQSVSGTVVPSANVVTYHPAPVTLGLDLNVTVLFTHIGTVTVNCVPIDFVLASTTISGIPTTSGATTTSAVTTTTGATTTSTAPTTTTSTVPATTSTVPTTTSTVVVTTSTVPTTTSTIPMTTTSTTGPPNTVVPARPTTPRPPTEVLGATAKATPTAAQWFAFVSFARAVMWQRFVDFVRALFDQGACRHSHRHGKVVTVCRH